MCSQGDLLDLKNEEYVVSLSLSWAELSSSSLLFPYRGQTPRGPIYLLPHSNKKGI